MNIELAEQRLLRRRTILPNGCWHFTGWHGCGYGEVTVSGVRYRSNRLAYMVWRGPIPEGMDILHTCDFKACINPAHLWCGDQAANSIDVVKKGKHYQMVRTHCSRGHSYAEHGVSYEEGKRSCKACNRGKQRIATGWPEDLAYSLPPGPVGYRPPEAGPVKIQPPKLKPQDKTHCKNGHEFTPENTYFNVGRNGRECKKCRVIAVRKNVERERLRAAPTTGASE